MERGRAMGKERPADGGASQGERRLRKSVKDLVAEANAQVETIAIAEARKLVGNPDVVFVDLREPGEAEATGRIEGSVAVPRGLLEFRADPESPLHQPELGGGKKLVLYCATAGRSALAAKALQDMGIENVAHLEGGYTAWAKGQPES